ncbi:MAG TPA: hypothetical protein VGD14_20320, partial [bacterium]
MSIRKFILLTFILLISGTGLFSQIESNSRDGSQTFGLPPSTGNGNRNSTSQSGLFIQEESAKFHQPSKQNSGDSLNVRLIGRWANGQCLAVDVVGNTAYFGNGAYLEIVDFSNPDDPKELGKTLLPATVLAIKVIGIYAYVAADLAGLRIVDISDPQHPKVAGYYDTPGNASGLDVNGTNLFLADAGAGLWIIDISYPYQPEKIGFIDTDGSALKVAVNGSFAYVADGSGGLRVIDISNPYQPKNVAQYATTDHVLDVAVHS